MTKILFIPVNSIQAELFSQIVKELNESVSYSFLSLDSIYRKRAPKYLAEPVLVKYKLPFKRIEEYKSIHPKHILKIENPDIIINSQDMMDPFIGRITKIANEQNMPILVIQDAFMFYEDSPYNSYEQNASVSIIDKINAIFNDAKQIVSIFSYGYNWKMRIERIFMRLIEIINGVPTRWGDGTYTKILVNGDYTRKMLESHQVDNSKIMIVGQPRWDRLPTYNLNITQQKAQKKFGLLTNQKIILLTTQPLVESKMWSEEDREYYLHNIVKIVSDQEDLRLIIKLHPRENLKAYEKIITKYNLKEKCLIYQNEDIYCLILCCDLLLTHICTTAIEAMILDKPIIAVDFKYSTENIPFVREGAAIGVSRPEDLLFNIRKVLNDVPTREALENARKKFVHKCAYLQDGKASKRIAELIVQTIEGTRSNTI